jgi:hypothetical protein
MGHILAGDGTGKDGAGRNEISSIAEFSADGHS